MLVGSSRPCAFRSFLGAISVGDIAAHTTPDLHARYAETHSAQASVVGDYLGLTSFAVPLRCRPDAG